MSSKLLMTLFCCLIACTGCNLIYKQNVQQGNAIEQDKLDQLKTGMTMNQVAYLLGTPAVRDPFHQNRWDYVYTFALRGGKHTSRKVTLLFENATLKEMIGINEIAQAPDGKKSEAKVASVEADASKPETVQPPVSEADEPVVTAIEQPVATDTEFESPQVETLVEAADPVAESTQAANDDPVTVPAEFVKPLPAGIPLAENNPTAYIIQLGAYDSLVNARSLVDRLRGAGFEVSVYMQVVEGLGPRFLVRSPGYDSKTEAERQLQQINSTMALDGFLIIPSRN